MESISHKENQNKWRCFVNKKTGQSFYVPVSSRHGRFHRVITGQKRYIESEWSTCKIQHLTLTVADNVSEISYRHIDRVLRFIAVTVKRAGAKFQYLWVKEMQKRGAVHFHVMLMTDKPRIIPSSSAIALSWRLGFVKITVCRGDAFPRMYNYLAKYIGKGYDYGFLETKRSFGASQYPSKYNLNDERLDDFEDRYGRYARYLKCTHRKVYFCGTDIDTLKQVKIPLCTYPTDWQYKGVFDEPF